MPRLICLTFTGRPYGADSIVSAITVVENRPANLAMSPDMEINSGVRNLLGLTEEELEAELGHRLSQTRRELDRANPSIGTRSLSFLADAHGLPLAADATGKTGKSFLRRFNRQLYALVCDETDPDGKAVRSAAAHGAEALSYALSYTLVGTFGWVPGIAMVIAVIIAKRATVAGCQTLCEKWRAEL